jgi:hypothetical protein
MSVARRRLSSLTQLSLYNRALRAGLVLGLVLGSTPVVRTQQTDALADTQQTDALAAARELYASAAYEEALATLDRLAKAAAVSDRDRATIDQYRALCLLALNRPEEATAAVEAMVRHDPLYAPAQDDISPRTRQVFQQVQRRLLPTIAQERYARAKAAYEEGRAQDAVAEFDGVLAVLDVVDAAGNRPPLMADLRVLAMGFRQLAATAAQAAAALEAASQPDASPPPVKNDSGPAPPAPIMVTPPVTLRQDFPAWPRDLPFPNPAVAVIEVVIGPDGRVQQARLQKTLHPRYDQMLLAAARNWTYRPALRDGHPTPFVKAVRLELTQAR